MNVFMFYPAPWLPLVTTDLIPPSVTFIFPTTYASLKNASYRFLVSSPFSPQEFSESSATHIRSPDPCQVINRQPASLLEFTISALSGFLWLFFVSRPFFLFSLCFKTAHAYMLFWFGTQVKRSCHYESVNIIKITQNKWNLFPSMSCIFCISGCELSFWKQNQQPAIDSANSW